MESTPIDGALTPPASTRERSGAACGPGRAWAAALGMATVAWFGNAWTRDLGFYADDYAQIAMARPLLERDLGMSDRQHEHHLGVPETFFRPALWAWFVLLRQIQGTPSPSSPSDLNATPKGADQFYAVVSPRLFHDASLLVHTLVVMLLTYSLARNLGLGPSLLGGIIASFWPGGSQAVSWIAASYVLLIAALGLIAVLLSLGARGWPRSLLAGVIASSTLLLHEAGAIVIMICLGIGLHHLFRRRSRAAIGLTVGLILGVLAVVVLRGYAKSEVPGYYLGGVGLEAAVRSDRIDPLCRAAGLAQDPGLQNSQAIGHLPERIQSILMDTGHRRQIRGVVGLVILGAALLIAFRRAAGHVLVGTLTLVITVLPASLVLVQENGGTERFFYWARLPLALLAASLLAIFVAGRRHETRRIRRLSRLGLILLVGWTVSAVPSLWLWIITQRDADAAARSSLANLDRVTDDLAAEAEVLVAEFPRERSGLPLIGNFLGFAANPPFRKHARRFHLVNSVDEASAIASGPLGVAPLQIVNCRYSEPQLWGPLLPGIPSAYPKLFLSSISSHAQTYDVEPPVATRFVRSIAIDLPRGPEDRVSVIVETTGQEIRLEAHAPARNEERRVTLCFPETEEWLFVPMLDRLRVESTTKTRPLRAPTLSEKSPELEVDFRVDGEGRDTTLTVFGQHPGTPGVLRLWWWARRSNLETVPSLYVFPIPAATDEVDVRWTWRLEENQEASHEFQGLPLRWLRWKNDILAREGIRSIRVEFLVELWNIDSTCMLQRSKRLGFDWKITPP